MLFCVYNNPTVLDLCFEAIDQELCSYWVIVWEEQKDRGFRSPESQHGNAAGPLALESNN